MSYRNAMCATVLVVAMLPVWASAGGEDPREAEYWLGRAEQELKAVKEDSEDRPGISRMDAVELLYRMAPTPARLEWARSIVREDEARNSQTKDRSARMVSHLALAIAHGSALQDAARAMKHLDAARALRDAGALENPELGAAADMLVPAAACGGNLQRVRAEAQRLPAGAPRANAYAFAARFLESRSREKEAAPLWTLAVAELDSISEESIRDFTAGLLARWLSRAGDFDNALQVAATLKDTCKSFEAYEEALGAARRAGKQETCAAAYEAIKSIWHFCGAQTVARLANRLAELGDGDRARELAAIAREKVETDPMALSQVARVYARLKDRDLYDKLAADADRIARRAVADQQRVHLMAAGSLAILGDTEAMNDRLAESAKLNEVVNPLDRYEQALDLIAVLLDRRRWDEAQKQIGLLKPGRLEYETGQLIRARLNAGEIDAAAASAEALQGRHRAAAWRWIAAARAKKGQVGELAKWVDTLEGPLSRAMVNLAVAEVLNGQPGRIGKMLGEEE